MGLQGIEWVVLRGHTAGNACGYWLFHAWSRRCPLLDFTIPHHANFQHGSKPGKANTHGRVAGADHAPANFTTVKHMAHNLIRKAPGKDSLRLRHKVAAWDDDFLASLVAA